MPIPKYDQMYKPFLAVLKDGKTHAMKDIRPALAAHFGLTDDDMMEMLPSGRQTVFANRSAWTKTYLKKAGLVDSPARASVVLTVLGKKVLSDNPETIDNEYLQQFEGFRKFISSEQSDFDNGSRVAIDDSKNTPDDAFEESFKRINDSLADEILSEVIKLSSLAFEQMVIDLLSKMGYGSFENAGKTTAASGDEGIDGIIMEDKLGFSLIYIQAKKWNTSSTVGRPEIQSFVGAISGKGGKGLFVTTATFSKQAIEYANRQHVILIDGNKLAKLMIEHDFGVTVKKVFAIKAIDTDVFNEYEDA